jgi:methylamine dehydrogenase accessory protein MauD
VLASDGDRDEHARFAQKHDLSRFPYVLSQELGLAYQIGKLPYAVLLDETGTVRAKGLVNTREHLESLFEAKERGVASLQQFVHGDRDRHGHEAHAQHA